ncbi:MAG: YCF48-related protein [Pseudomonadota bacterium]
MVKGYIAPAAVLALGACAVYAQEDVVDPATLPSYLAADAAQSMLLDVVRTGDQLIAVGEHGHVLRSSDDGRSWAQVVVPSRAALTGVAFADPEHGIVVGHDAVILRTADAGATWEVVYSDPDYQTPLLDVWMPSPERIVAIGAYGFYLESTDGGENWEQRTFRADPLPSDDDAASDEVDAEEDDAEEEDYGIDYHLNQIAQADDGTLYIAGEAGTFYRSDNSGEDWYQLEPDYEGSFFGALPLTDGALLAFGMRGNLFRSEDRGRTFDPIETGVDALLTSGFRRADGSVVVVGLAGVVLESSDGKGFTLHRQSDRKGAMSALSAEDGAAVLAGEAGVVRLTQDAYRNGGAP